jgi:hypothetical protein
MRSPIEPMTQNAHPARRRLHLGAWLVIAAAAAGVALLLRRWLQSGFDWALFGSTLRTAQWHWLAAAWALAVLSYWGRAERWLVMLRPLAPQATSAALFRDTAIGYTALTLLGRAGEIVRPWLIARTNNVPVSSQISAWVLERIYDTLIVLGVFGFALLSASGLVTAPGSSLHRLLDVGGAALGVLAATCLAVLVAMHGVPHTLEERLQALADILPESRREAASRFVSSTLSTLRAANSWSAVLRLLGWSVVEWLILISAYVAIFRAFPETRTLTLAQTLSFLGFVSFGSIVQIPGVGGGVQLASILVLTEYFHIPLAASTGIALVGWATSFLGIMPIGLVLALRQGISWTQLKSATKEFAP